MIKHQQKRYKIKQKWDKLWNKYSSCFHYYWVIKPIRIFIFGRSRRKWKSGRSDIKVTSTSQNHWVVFQNGTFLMDESHPRSLKSFSTIFTSCLSCYVNSKPFFEIIVVYNFKSVFFFRFMFYSTGFFSVIWISTYFSLITGGFFGPCLHLSKLFCIKNKFVKHSKKFEREVFICRLLR